MRFAFNPLTGEFDLVTRPGEKQRRGIELIGTIDGVNTTFTTPEYFLHEAAGETIAVYYNGQRMYVGAANDYLPSESGGPGTGYDTITLTVAPRVGDRVTADYKRLY